MQRRSRLVLQVSKGRRLFSAAEIVGVSRITKEVRLLLGALTEGKLGPVDDPQRVAPSASSRLCSR
jgi:hypothetical protein